MNGTRKRILVGFTAVVLAPLAALRAGTAPPEAKLPDPLPPGLGICVLLDPQPAEMAAVLAGKQEWLLYCQLPPDAQVAAARLRLDRAGLLGTRVYVEKGPPDRIHLADNLADVVIVTREAAEAWQVDRKELLRVVNPLGKVLFGDRQLTKPFAEGTDDWACDCNVSLIGNITLAPAGDFNFQPDVNAADRLETSAPVPGAGHGEPLGAGKAELRRNDPQPGEEDWPTFRADNVRSAAVPLEISRHASLAWTYAPRAAIIPAAPIVAYGMVLSAGSDGVVRAIHAGSGALKWSAYTGGPIQFPPAAHRGRFYVGSGDGWVYCLDAESGRICWRFRAAPAERRIPVFGRLSSTWPVGSGVLADQGVVYAAAGLAGSDGTHVYALDAETGKVRWHNGASGCIENMGGFGVSVQGHLLLHAGKLYLAGRNTVSPAVYDACDGRFRNEIPEGVRTPRTNANPVLLFVVPRGQDLFLIQDQVRCLERRLYGPNRYVPGRSPGPLVLAHRAETVVRELNGRVARVKAQSAVGKPKVVWQSPHLQQTYALALGTNSVLAAGQLEVAGPATPRYAVVALTVDRDRILWSRELPAQPAGWGLAADKAGRIFVSLVDGRVLCFATDRAAVRPL